MATNPMQRKSRMSFLLGMFITLLITGAVIAILVMQLMEKAKKEKEEEQLMANVLVLNQDVISGQVITEDMLSMKTVNLNLIPSNATSDYEVVGNYGLQDKDGNNIATKYDADKNSSLFIQIGNNAYRKVNQIEATGNYYTEYIKYNDYNYDICSEEIGNNNKAYMCLFITVGNDKYELRDSSGNRAYIKYGYEDQGKFYVLQKNNEERQINQNEVRFRCDGKSDIAYTPENKYIELNNIPYVAKVNMNSNTVITLDLLSKADSIVQNDVRRYEFNVIALPMDLAKDQYVDIRLMLPDGQDFVVISKKSVDVPWAGGAPLPDTIWMNLSEDELLSMNCAIVESAQVEGSKLYAVKYTDAGMQDAAEITYPVSQNIASLIINNPNVLETAKRALLERRNTDQANSYRNVINGMLDGGKGIEGIKETIENSMNNTRAARENYLKNL